MQKGPEEACSLSPATRTVPGPQEDQWAQATEDGPLSRNFFLVSALAYFKGSAALASQGHLLCLNISTTRFLKKIRAPTQHDSLLAYGDRGDFILRSKISEEDSLGPNREKHW